MEIQKVDFDEVNKLLITGYSEKDNASISSLLTMHGIKYAKPSKNEQMEATDITEIILKTHKNNFTEQIKVSSVWNNLALDLFLGNIDQEIWCWNDTKAISLLNYWKGLDSQIAFVLVYNSPEQIISEILKSEKNNVDIDTILEEWIVYNRRLLDFYYKNRDKSLLIHAKQVKENQLHYLNFLEEKMGIEFKNNETKNIFVDHFESKVENTNGIEHFLVSQIISENLQVQELYEELQSVSNIFYKNQLSKLDTKNVLYSFLEKENQLNQILKQRQIEQDQNKLLKNKIKSIEIEFRDKIEQKSVEYNHKINEFKEIKEENEALLNQLFTVQEELEKYYIENKNLKENQESVKRYYGAGERLKNELGFKLGTQIVHSSRSLIGILFMPFSLLSVYSKHKEDMTYENLPPVEEYADAYEAERVKSFLTYQLGQTTLQTMKNPVGIFVLPFRLYTTYKLHKKQREV